MAKKGFVYVLLNPAFPNLVKIGLTTRTSEERAVELRGTGVPSHFIVLYDELVTDCEEVERRLHAIFDGYRHADDREFFHVPPKQAIQALQRIAGEFRVADAALTNRVEILDALRAKHGDIFADDLVSVAIVQLTDVCFLESIRRTTSMRRDEIVERIDLGFVSRKDESMFPLTETVQKNSATFVEEMDLIGLLMCTNLLNEETKNRAGRLAAAETEDDTL